MKFSSFHHFSGKPKEKKDPRSEFIAEVKEDIEDIFKKGENPEGRINLILSRIEEFLKYSDRSIFSQEQYEEIKRELTVNLQVENKSEFSERAMEIVTPLVEIWENHPVEYEEAQARMANARAGYVEINRLVSYHKNGTTIMLHHPPAKTIGPKREIYAQAMRSLAEIIRNDPTIERVEAVSWIVKKAASLFARNGFTVEEVKFPNFLDSFPLLQITEKDSDRREIGLAFITREDFLKRFGEISEAK